MKCGTLEETGHFILMCVYTLCPPFYMMMLTYLLSTYRGISNFVLSDIIPVFWKTIWIPAMCSFVLCFIFQARQKRANTPPAKIKDYPLVFIFFYSIYFMILGQISWGSDCMYGGISGLLLVLFGWLFRDNLNKCVIHLPKSEKFYAYVVVFLFPVFVLLTTDVISLMQNQVFFMTILVAPIAYIGGLSFFLLACLALRGWCAYENISLKKNTYTLSQLILLSLIGNHIFFIYLMLYVGNTVFWVGFLMSVFLYFIEFLYEIKRRFQQKHLS